MLYPLFSIIFSTLFPNAPQVGTKWVGVSPARFRSISSSPSDLTVEILGGVGEKVVVSFYNSAAAAEEGGGVVDVACTIPSGGAARVSVPGKTCTTL